MQLCDRSHHLVLRLRHLIAAATIVFDLLLDLWGARVPRLCCAGDLVREMKEGKERQEGVERVLMAMGAQIPWATEPAPQPLGVQTMAVSQAAPEHAQQRQRNPIAVTAGPLQDGGATGFAALARRPVGAVEGEPRFLVLSTFITARRF